MMVSTCSGSTFIETSFDIYSGTEDCENLLCASFVALPCGGLYSGGENDVHDCRSYEEFVLCSRQLWLIPST